MSEAVAINVVFTDLVGSTEMSSRLGPEATEALRLVHFGLLRGAMEAHGGSEVKNLGDGLMVVFPGLTSALNGSVAMQQAIERHNSSGKEPLGVRVGLATGDATEEDGDYFGEPVVEAARLCAKCEAGQIITTELVSMMARKSGHSFESIGELELKGVPEPVPAVTLEWEPVQVEGALVMPGRITPDMDQALAGRAAETAALGEAFKAAEAGDSRITFLAGEPGIGKTRLAAELATHAHSRGAVVLYGRADEELTVPYQPWVEAMTHLLEHAPTELVEEALRLHGPELATLVPSLRRRNPDLATPHSTDPETERYLLLQAVTATISMLAADAPVLVVLDDLHWAGKPTLTMLRHLFTNVDAAKVMIVCTYRDSDLETGHPLIDTVAALRREPGVEQLSVRGLDDLEMIALVEASAGHDLDDRATEMAVLLRRESAGNPFFAHEILRNLVESGDLVLGADGRWVVEKDFDELAVPQSVRDVVGQRIARLGEDTLKTLSAAAVIGRDFELALLAEVTGADEDDLLDLVEAAAKAGILVEVPGGDEQFRFQHTLARQTLEAGLSEGRRRRMHRKVAEAIEATVGDDPGDRVGELATHWFAATASVDTDKVTRYARLAGERAEAGLAPDEAVRWFTMALENLDLADNPDDQVRAALLVDLGTSQKHAGDPAYRQTLLDAAGLAARLGETDLMVTAALANNRGFNSKIGEQDDERIAGLEAAVAAVGVDPTAERARLLATLTSELEYAGPLDERTALFDEAVAIARGLDDPATLAQVLNRFCMSLAVPQTLEARRAAAAESTAIAEDLGDLTLQFWAAAGGFQAAVAAVAVDDAHAALDRMDAAVDEIGRPGLRWIAGYLRGSMATTTNDGDEIERLATENFAVGEDAGEPDALDYFAFAVVSARWYQGRGPEILDQVHQAVADTPGVPTLLAVEAAFHEQNGDPDQARALLREAAAREFEYPINNSWSATLTIWAIVAAYLRDVDAARTLYDLLTPWAGQIATSRVAATSPFDAALARLAAVLGDVDGAEAHFAAAEAQCDALGARYWNAHADVDRALMYLARDDTGDRALAEDYATKSLDCARERGYGDLERRAAAFLDALPAA